jgi:hypothetical protein
VRETIPLRSLSGNIIVEKVLGGAAETIYREINVTGLRRLRYRKNAKTRNNRHLIYNVYKT